MKYFFSILIVFLFFQVSAQDMDTIAAKIIIAKNKKDTNTVNAYYNYAWIKKHSDIESAKLLIENGINLSKKINWKDGLRKCYYAKGNILHRSDELENAIIYINKSLVLAKELKSKLAIADCYNGLGLINDDLAKQSKAIDYFFKAIKEYSSINYDKGLVKSYSNLGNVYYDMADFEKALFYHSKSLELAKIIKDDMAILHALVNSGLSKQELGQIDTAIVYLKEALIINEKMNDPQHIMQDLYNNIGAAYMRIKIYDLALEYLNKSYEINFKENNENKLAMNAGNIGLLHYYQGNFSMGERYLLNSRDISRKLKLRGLEAQAESLLSELNVKRGDYKKAFEHNSNYLKLSDSINNVEEQKKIAVRENEFKNQQKAASDSLERLKEDELKRIQHEQEVSQQRFYTYGGIGIAVISLAFLGFVYRGLRQKKRANKLLEEKNILIQQQKVNVETQKLIIEEKHKEINDSIDYAERLQRSLMASKPLLDKNLREYFIYFNPKEAVSGDFYWAAELKNGHFLIICADSTGHGVPGSIMSMMNMTSLKETVKDGITQPNEILNHTRQIIIQTLENDGSLEGGKDGMDAALLSFDFRNKKLSFALANNPIWIIRKNELIEFSPDKMPVGKHDKQHISFTHHEFQLESGDLIVALTDGFADQFGGEKGKKFKYAGLKNILLENSNSKVEEIHSQLNIGFQKWKGDLEQVDDVCIIGIRI